VVEFYIRVIVITTLLSNYISGQKNQGLRATYGGDDNYAPAVSNVVALKPSSKPYLYLEIIEGNSL